MGRRVIAIIRVLPESIDVDLEELVKKIKDALPEGVELRAHEVKPIAFGLSALRIMISMPGDIEGGTSTVEDAIRSLDDVSEVDVEFVSLEH